MSVCRSARSKRRFRDPFGALLTLHNNMNSKTANRYHGARMLELQSQAGSKTPKTLHQEAMDTEILLVHVYLHVDAHTCVSSSSSLSSSLYASFHFHLLTIFISLLNVFIALLTGCKFTTLLQVGYPHLNENNKFTTS